MVFDNIYAFQPTVFTSEKLIADRILKMSTIQFYPKNNQRG